MIRVINKNWSDWSQRVNTVSDATLLKRKVCFHRFLSPQLKETLFVLFYALIENANKNQWMVIVEHEWHTIEKRHEQEEQQRRPTNRQRHNATRTRVAHHQLLFQNRPHDSSRCTERHVFLCIVVRTVYDMNTRPVFKTSPSRPPLRPSSPSQSCLDDGVQLDWICSRFSASKKHKHTKTKHPLCLR